MSTRYTIQITSGQGSRSTRFGDQTVTLAGDEILETDDAALVEQLGNMDGLTIRTYVERSASTSDEPAHTPRKRELRYKESAKRG